MKMDNFEIVATIKYPDYTKYMGIVKNFPIADLPPASYKPFFQRDVVHAHVENIKKSIINGKMVNDSYWFWKFNEDEDKLKVIEGSHRFTSYTELNLLDPKKYQTITIIATIIECNEEKAMQMYSSLHKLRRHNFGDVLKKFSKKHKFFPLLKGLCVNEPPTFFSYTTAFNLIISGRNYVNHEDGHLFTRETRGNIKSVKTNLESITIADIDKVKKLLGVLKDFSLNYNFTKKAVISYIFAIYYYNDFSLKKTKLYLSKLQNNRTLHTFLKEKGVNDESSNELLKKIEKIVSDMKSGS